MEKQITPRGNLKKTKIRDHNQKGLKEIENPVIQSRLRSGKTFPEFEQPVQQQDLLEVLMSDGQIQWSPQYFPPQQFYWPYYGSP